MNPVCAPSVDCSICPRLVDFRGENREKFPDKHNAPVPSFGSIDAKLLIVGLAPGLKGANFSGRPFTGDAAGDYLYENLISTGFAKGEYKARADDGVELVNCRITNAVRCVPPQNKPVGAEINACRDFLKTEIEAMRNLKVILSLGLVSHNSVVKVFGGRVSQFKFAHKARHRLSDKVTLVDSYHCSRYNMNTGRLTEDSFKSVFYELKEMLQAG